MEIDDIQDKYDAKSNPEVVQGKKTEAEVRVCVYVFMSICLCTCVRVGRAGKGESLSFLSGYSCTWL